MPANDPSQPPSVEEATRRVLDGFGCPSPDDDDGNETWCGGCVNAVQALIASVRAEASGNAPKSLESSPPALRALLDSALELTGVKVGQQEEFERRWALVLAAAIAQGHAEARQHNKEAGQCS